MQSTRTTMYLNFKVGMVHRSIFASDFIHLLSDWYVMNLMSPSPKLIANRAKHDKFFFVYIVQSL